MLGLLLKCVAPLRMVNQYGRSRLVVIIFSHGFAIPVSTASASGVLMM